MLTSQVMPNWSTTMPNSSPQGCFCIGIVVFPPAAGFRATSTAAEAASAWPGVIDVADQHDASFIVLGSHGRSGLACALVGSVAGAVAAYSRRSVLNVHQH